jgi:hypothetical protein
MMDDATQGARRMRGQEPPPDDQIATHAYAEEGTGADLPTAAAVRWNGRPTSFTLVRPLLRNHRVMREGEVITFNVMPHPSIPGEFVGCDDPLLDDAPHVTDLYRLGMFARTKPADERTRKQNAIDIERCVYEGSEDGVPLTSLAALDGARLEAMLRRHRGIGTPEQLRASEQLAARTAAPTQERVWPGAEAAGTARRTP